MRSGRPTPLRGRCAKGGTAMRSGGPTPLRGRESRHRSTDLGRELRALDLDTVEAPLDLSRIDHPGPEMAGRPRPAGDAVDQAVLRAASAVPRRHEPGQERVARADRRARLDRA